MWQYMHATARFSGRLSWWSSFRWWISCHFWDWKPQYWQVYF